MSAQNHPRRGRTWNRLRPEEEAIVCRRLQSGSLCGAGSRQLAAYLTDHRGVAVSIVYLLLRREGVVMPAEF